MLYVLSWAFFLLTSLFGQNSSSSKRLKGIALKDEKRILKEEADNTSVTSAKHAKQNKKATEESKQDYIHVRARRGQATDSHSLAERVSRALPFFFSCFQVLFSSRNCCLFRILFLNWKRFLWQARREKISERMKLLQDLVPGCKKVILKKVVSNHLKYLSACHLLCSQEVECFSCRLLVKQLCLMRL